MSYQVTIIGEDFARDIEAEGSLQGALDGFDAKFVNHGFGVFLEEIAGMKYKEVDGGIYTWMLYKADNSGMHLADEGIKQPTHSGEHFYFLYKFLPNNDSKSAYEVPVLTVETGEEPTEYVPVTPEKYEEPEIISYEDFSVEEKEKVEEYTYQQEEEVVYSRPDFTFVKQPVLSHNYAVVFGFSTPNQSRQSIALPIDNGDIEKFIMELLSEARLNFLISKASLSLALPQLVV